MLEPDVPFDEAKRIAALYSLKVLDTPAEARFDRLTRLAQYIFDVPIALISLVDTDRQWFKSCQGLAVTEMPRNISFCGHAILGETIFFVPDATLDSRFEDNPLVIGAPHIRFYAGAPLILANGQRVGTLCVIDYQPRQKISSEQFDRLSDLARCVSEELARGVQQEITLELAMFQARYSAIIASSDDAIMSKTLDGVITTWNPAAETLFGYRVDEAVGQPMLMIIPKERAAEEPQIIARIRRGERIEHFETVRVAKNGQRLDVSVGISPIMDGAGKIIGASQIVRDVSERKNSLQLQQDSEARIAAILDNVLDGIITINDQGVVESFNKAAEMIFSYRAAEVIGKNVNMLMPEPYHGEHDGYLFNYRSTHVKKIIGIGRQVFGRRRDGSTFPMDLAVSAMKLDNQPMFTGIVRDITERVKIERMKFEFISTVSHELRTPLTSIRGSLGLIAGGLAGELPMQAKELVDIAYKNSERLILLVNDILDIEKIGAGKMEFQPAAFSLTAQLQQAIENNSAYAAQYSASYELTGALSDVSVYVDANRFQQVLANLLSNAAKFSPAGDKVGVDIVLSGSHVRVAVNDHGSGISAQFHDQVFQKFAQGDSSDTRQKGGTGLGLSISKAIVEQMGGVIGFDSEPNVLTSFWIEFPVYQEATMPENDDTEGRQRVLICEDDLDVANLLSLMLEQAEVVTDIATNALEAKQLLAQHRYAAMTLDLALPGQSGMDLLQELRADADTAALPVIVVSASSEVGDSALSGNAFSVVDWIQKPVDKDRLLKTMTQALALSSRSRPKVLHVEDDSDVCHVVKTIVGELVDMDNAPSLREAKRMILAKRYDMVILDVGLPDGSGMDLLPLLNKAVPPIPVMVFSANEKEASLDVVANLVKSRTDNTQLLATIKRLVGI